MSNQWIDVSVPLHNGMVHWPGDEPFNRETPVQIAKGDPCNVSKITCTVHIGTHMDAPHHFFDGGAGIETMPLEAAMGPAAPAGPALVQIGNAATEAFKDQGNQQTASGQPPKV